MDRTGTAVPLPRPGRVAVGVLALVLVFAAADARRLSSPDTSGTPRIQWDMYVLEGITSTLFGGLGFGLLCGGGIALAHSDVQGGSFAGLYALGAAGLVGFGVGYPVGCAMGTLHSAQSHRHRGNTGAVYLTAFGTTLLAAVLFTGVDELPEGGPRYAGAAVLALTVPAATVYVNHRTWLAQGGGRSARLSGPSLALRGTPLPDGRACRSLDLRLLTLGI